MTGIMGQTVTRPRKLAWLRRPPAVWLAGLLVIGALALLGSFQGGVPMHVLRLLHSGVDVHRDTSHFFFLDGYQSVMCARNTGLYCGAFIAVIWAWRTGRGRAEGLPPFRVSLLSALLIGIMVADGFNSLASDLGYDPAYSPSNALRLATGLSVGAVVALYALPVLNSFLWREHDPRPIVDGFGSMLRLFAWALPLWLISVLGVGLFALPVAVLTTGASLFLFGLLNLVIAIIALRWDNRFASARSVARPLCAACIAALIELSLLAWVMPQLLPGLYHA